MLRDETPLSCVIRDALLAPLAQASAILLAVSGGPDSTALLKLAADWRAADPSRPDIFAASVDHGLRPEARGEVEAVAKLAQKLGVPHAILTWEGEKPRSALQEKARAARYGLLVGHARAIGADSLCTAHHADDQAETVLMRMARGSGIAGLAGMRPVTMLDGLRLLRPLLDIPKSGLVAFCKAQGLVFAQDSSNVDDRFARARVRKLADVLAVEGLSAARFTELARRAARADDALASLAQIVAGRVCTRSANGARIDFAALLNEPEDIGLRVLAGQIAHLSAVPLRMHRLESAFTRLTQACRQGESLKLSLGGGLLHLDAAGSLQLRAEPARRRGRVRTMQSVHVID